MVIVAVTRQAPLRAGRWPTERETTMVRFRDEDDCQGDYGPRGSLITAASLASGRLRGIDLPGNYGEQPDPVAARLISACALAIELYGDHFFDELAL